MRVLSLALLGAMLFPIAVLASEGPAPLPVPQGPVVLTVSGAISVHNHGEAAAFDVQMLEEIGVTEVTTETIWTEGPQDFVGVSLRAVLDRVGAEGTTIEAAALNDYAVKIPASDAVIDGPILAYRIGETRLSVRDKGPLWIIYPFDDNPAYQAERYYSRSVWQLNRLIVQP